MRGDFDEDEWDGTEPFMLGDCSRCGMWTGICCGKDGVGYCSDCCDHPWSDDEEAQAVDAVDPVEAEGRSSQAPTSTRDDKP